MKVLHIASGFPIGFAGGVTNYVRSLARSQNIEGHQVSILCGPSGGQQADSMLGEIYEFEGVSSVFSLSTERDDVKKSEWLHRLVDEHDIVHFHMGYGLPKSFYNTEMTRPYVVSLHDYGYICPRIFMVDKFGQTCDTRDLSKCRTCVGAIETVNLIRAVANRLKWSLPTIASDATLHRAKRLDYFLRHANKRIAVSTKVAEIFSAAITGSHFDVIHIGNETAKPIVPRYSWMPDSVLRCCFIGTLNRDKGADVFIELVKALSGFPVEFAFWGRGDPDYVDELTALGVDCRGAYTPSQLTSIMSGVDVGLVLPVWNDNGPQVLMEFINHGVPVLGTSMGGVPDFLNEATGFLFDPKKEINKAVEWLKSLNATMLQYLHNNITPLKTPNAHAIEMTIVYQKALGIKC